MNNGGVHAGRILRKNERIYVNSDCFSLEAKENSKELEKVAGKENSKKILDIIKTQKKKTSVLKKEIFLKSNKPDGLRLIKDILGKIKNVEIKYISAGRYSLKKETEDIKKADSEIKNSLESLEKEARKEGMEFSILKK